jgi:hypothetical protein
MVDKALWLIKALKKLKLKIGIKDLAGKLKLLHSKNINKSVKRLSL